MDIKFFEGKKTCLETKKTKINEKAKRARLNDVYSGVNSLLLLHE